MDNRKFDSFTRALATGRNRRSLLKGVLGLGGATLATATNATDAARRPTPTPKPVKCPGTQQWDGTKCTCGTGTNCGPDCCTGGSVCCDNACCHGQCYGEERCCPTGQTVCNDACCPPGEECIDGVCTNCTPCGNVCCSEPKAKCCQDNVGSTCVSPETDCCNSDNDCVHLSHCDGAVLTVAYCWRGICLTTPQNCNQGEPCRNYSCIDNDGPTCLDEPIPGCCSDASQCQRVDACTPAHCLDDDSCNAVSACGEGQQCCAGSGVCVSAGAVCCTDASECRHLDHCAFLSAVWHNCTDYVCVENPIDCQGRDGCMTYGCDDSDFEDVHCTETYIDGCCGEHHPCQPVDACTPDHCLDNHTCQTFSNCTVIGEICCADGHCSRDGSCNRGPTLCTIDGVQFLPCVDGCPLCLPDDHGAPCGCAVVTSTACSTTADCQAINTSWICGGSFCVYPLLPTDE